VQANVETGPFPSVVSRHWRSERPLHFEWQIESWSEGLDLALKLQATDFAKKGTGVPNVQ
jgi:hypothetical protein